MRRVLTIFGLGLVVAAALAAWIWRPDRMIEMASAAVSQTVCTKAFVTGLPPADAYAQNMAAEMGLIAGVVDMQADEQARRVRTTVFGMFASEATFTDGYGCRLTMAENVPLAPYDRAGDVAASLPEIAPADVVAPANAALSQAIDRMFAPRPKGPPRWTHAVVIVHDGRVVGERYGPGIGVDTPLLSHSIAKSVATALIGILARDGAIKPDAHIDQLMRMSSGLPLDEGVGPGISQRMWFAERDHGTCGPRCHAGDTVGLQQS
jgi:CubicO group peptidase (beta-lactamase class C family)